MTDPGPSRQQVAEACALATARLDAALTGLGPDDITGPSRLPGWTRLTIVCHLRYGAVASARMTDDALAGRATAFYPGGRESQRPATLTLRAGETPADALRSLRTESERLSARWSALPGDAWATAVREPPGVHDLGEIDLATLALLRLTELEVHGSDLDVGLDRWSDVFVAAALPVRLARLDRQRRVGPDHPLVGTTWRLHEVGGPDHLVTLRPTSTEVRPAGGQPPRADAVIEGTADDLLALVLGRPTLGPLTYAGNPALAGGFTTAYGGP